LIMSLVVFAWLSNDKFFKEWTDINTIQQLRAKTADEIEAQLLPFGFIDDGSDRVVYDLGAPFESWFIVPDDEMPKNF